MEEINIRDAIKKFYKLSSKCITDNNSFKIATDKGNVILLSRKVYDSLVESFYLYSIPGIHESIEIVTKTPTEKLDTNSPLK